MKTVITVLGLFLIGSLLGCGGGHSLAPVSGTVTVDGKPEGGIKLYFTPVAIEGEINSGPFSTAITDENGGFVLEDRYGNTGAVVGKHRAIISYADANSASGKILTTPESEKARKELQNMLKGRGIRVDPREAEAKSVMVEIEVPSDGTDTLKIELLSR